MRTRLATLMMTVAALSLLGMPPAAAHHHPCGVGDLHATFTRQTIEHFPIESFQSVNRSSHPTDFEWVVSRSETEEWQLGGEVGGGADWIFWEVKAQVNGHVKRTYTSSTEHRLRGTVGPRSEAIGTYGFSILHFDGYYQNCRERGPYGEKHHFDGTAPTGHQFIRHS